MSRRYASVFDPSGVPRLRHQAELRISREADTRLQPAIPTQIPKVKPIAIELKPGVEIRDVKIRMKIPPEPRTARARSAIQNRVSKPAIMM